MILPKIRLFKIAFGVVVLALATIVTKDQFSVFRIRELQSRIDALETEKAEMLLYAERIRAARRVAQVNVIEQDAEAEGGPVTVLHWQQIGTDGLLGPAEVLTLRGTQVYFEAMVAKFEYDLIGRAAPGKSTNLAMFRRAFGDAQMPSTGHPLDHTDPMVRDDTGAMKRETSEADAAIRARFWELMDKPALAAEYGIRIVQCEAPSVRVKPGQIWEVTLDAAGGLNLKKIGERGEKQPSTVNKATSATMH